MRARAMMAWMVSVGLAACNLTIGGDGTIEGGGAEDGAVCQTNTDCRSGTCLFNLCAGSSCTCPGSGCSEQGQSSPDCADGWVCAHFVSDDFFYTSSYDRCVAPCGHCPAHFSCSDGDEFCSQDDSWADLVVTAAATPMQVAPGDTVQFEASATSPVGDADFVFHWHFSDDPSNAVPGQKVTHAYPMSGVFQETVDVDAANDTKHAEGYVTVTVCGTAGVSCSNGSDANRPPCCAGLTCVEESSFDAHCQ